MYHKISQKMKKFFDNSNNYVGDFMVGDMVIVSNKDYDEKYLGRIDLIIAYPEQIFIKCSDDNMWIVDRDNYDIVKITTDEELFLAKLSIQ